MNLLRAIRVTAVLCLILGLAPFYPEPHIWGKLKWVLGGANGMQGGDWFDLLMHGFPFILLSYLIIIKLFKKNGA